MLRINLLILTVMLLLTARAGAAEQVWQEVPEAEARGLDSYPRQYQVDSLALRAILQRVTEVVGPGSVQTIRLPMPDGSLADFEIYESPIMQDKLAQRFPGTKTYKVYGIDDPIASGRLDITSRGFHAMLHTSQGRLFIDPHTSSQQPDRYQARTQNASPSSAYSCGIDDHGSDMSTPRQTAASSPRQTAGRGASDVFQQYRLAVSATSEYVERITGSTALISDAQEEIATAINRVNQIYERDLGITFVLVDDNDELIENAGNVIFSNGDSFQMLIENQAWIDFNIGRSNYDIGHVFGTGNGGLARLGSVCDINVKAHGVSGINDPLGDPFYIDFVSHEIGHQFNALHSFNGSTDFCEDARNQASAFEPGSGSTIMAYAGICGVENLQTLSEATFHAGSIAVIDSFTNAGGSCFNEVTGVVGNMNQPIIAAIANSTIPANTAFVLDGSATDADGNTLSYQWDQMDTGCPTDALSFGTDTGFNGLFRSYAPRSVSKRHFPALGTQLEGLFDDAEVIPCNNRNVNLRLTVRDQFSGQDSEDVRVAVSDTGAVFEITSLDAPFQIHDTSTPLPVTWRVAGTDQAPINCSNVDIELLTIAADDRSYSVHPLLTTTNDGSESVDFPMLEIGNSHPRARIRVKCSDNIFYDISAADFSVDGTASGTGTFSDDENTLFQNLNGTTGLAPPACGAIVECLPPPDPDDSEDGGSGNGDSSAVDYRWLLLLGGILLIARVRRARRAY
jgi:hypothetical protein